MATYRSITFCVSVEKKQQIILAQYIEDCLREPTKAHFRGAGVQFAVSAYPAGLIIAGRQYASGSVVRIVATTNSCDSSRTIMAGFDGSKWDSIPIKLYPPRSAKKK